MKLKQNYKNKKQIYYKGLVGSFLLCLVGKGFYPLQILQKSVIINIYSVVLF